MLVPTTWQCFQGLNPDLGMHIELVEAHFLASTFPQQPFQHPENLKTGYHAEWGGLQHGVKGEILKHWIEGPSVKSAFPFSP